jgi:hypothetical protein
MTYTATPGRRYRQAPLRQVVPAGHARPHAPQFAASLPSWTQAPGPQSARPGAHDEQQRNPVSPNEKSSATTSAWKSQRNAAAMLLNEPPRRV